MTSAPPTTPPPGFIPLKSQSQTLPMTGFGIDHTLLKACMLKKTYIWFRDNMSFWVWITFIGGGHAIGWRWNGSDWVNFEIDLRRIDNFICYI